jgi:hypothetical protein
MRRELRTATPRQDRHDNLITAGVGGISNSNLISLSFKALAQSTFWRYINLGSGQWKTHKDEQSRYIRGRESCAVIVDVW